MRVAKSLTRTICVLLFHFVQDMTCCDVIHVCTMQANDFEDKQRWFGRERIGKDIDIQRTAISVNFHLLHTRRCVWTWMISTLMFQINTRINSRKNFWTKLLHYIKKKINNKKGLSKKIKKWKRSKKKKNKGFAKNDLQLKVVVNVCLKRCVT